MRELLSGMGWTDMAINICEIAVYAILILSGLIAIIKQTIKSINKLVPRFKEIKCLKHKLKAIQVFYTWYVKAIKDGYITDEELDSINAQFSDIIDSCNNKEDLQFDIECSKANTAIDNATKVIESDNLDSDGCDD